MRIHYTAPAWHGGYQKFFAAALRSLGHEVFYFNDCGSRPQKLFQKVFARLPRLQYAADDIFREAVSRDWIRSVRSFGSNLLILEHAPNILPEYIRQARKEGIKIIYWMDSPPAGGQAKDVLAGFGEGDVLFSVDRKWMTILYAPDDFHYLPVAGDPETFYQIENAKKEYDVVWVGSFPPQTGDGYLRAKIIAEIPEKYRVAAFGNGANYWVKYFPILQQRVRSGSLLSAEKLNEIYNKTEIILNIHSTSNVSSISGRTYEIALSGAFQLVDWREDLDILYPEGGLVSFRYAKEINGLIEEWMRKPEERARRAEKVREYTLNHHTWKRRAEEMLKHFKK